jgi:hypothetical protein
MHTKPFLSKLIPNFLCEKELPDFLGCIHTFVILWSIPNSTLAQGANIRPIWSPWSAIVLEGYLLQTQDWLESANFGGKQEVKTKEIETRGKFSFFQDLNKLGELSQAQDHPRSKLLSKVSNPLRWFYFPLTILLTISVTIAMTNGKPLTPGGHYVPLFTCKAQIAYICGLKSRSIFEDTYPVTNRVSCIVPTYC